MILSLRILNVEHSVNNTELTSLTIGDQVYVRIENGHLLDSSLKLSIKKCSLQSIYTTIELINEQTPNPDLKGLVVASESTSNSEAQFEWHVFSIGNDNQAR